MSLVVLALVIVIAVFHPAPAATGVPANKVLANQTRTPAPGEETRPLVLEEYACDDAHCYDYGTANWYFCDPSSCSSAASVTVTYDWNVPEVAGTISGSAIAGAGFCTAIGQVELAPICALAAVLGGTSYETYKVEGEWWCEFPDSIPETPKEMLWCADGR